MCISLACARAVLVRVRKEGTRIPSVRSFVLTSGPVGGPPPPLANIRAVTTSRNHTALAPRVALSGAAEVGRSTVTAGCTAEAYANRLDFARMAFLFVVKNGACEPRGFRDDPLLRGRPCVRFFRARPPPRPVPRPAARSVVVFHPPRRFLFPRAYVFALPRIHARDLHNRPELRTLKSRFIPSVRFFRARRSFNPSPLSHPSPPAAGACVIPAASRKKRGAARIGGTLVRAMTMPG